MMREQKPHLKKPREPCKYWKRTPQGCFSGSKCRFRHDDPVFSPHDLNKICFFFQRGYCKRGEDCWYKHEAESADEEHECVVCYDTPKKFGLLAECNHALCHRCATAWRRQKSQGPQRKTCPLCRTPISLVIPSSRFHAHGTSEKKEALCRYKESMGKVDCCWFVQSERSFCPLGSDCFYRHTNADGTPCIMELSAKECMRLLPPPEPVQYPHLVLGGHW